MRVELSSALYQSPVSAVRQVERSDVEKLQYIKTDPDQRGSRQNRQQKQADRPADVRFESTPSDALATTIVELQLSALTETQTEAEPSKTGPEAYRLWSEA